MPPQVVNMDLLLSSELSQHQILGLEETLKVVRHEKTTDPDSKSLLSSHSSSDGSLRRKSTKRNRRYSLTHAAPQEHHPLHVIRTLLFPGGKSMAYCNDETLSSSFLILDGFMTISLVDGKDNDSSISHVEDAIERWGKRLETNICVGKVSYEYRLSDEDEKSMSHVSSDSERSYGSNEATILSQNLEKVPLVLDQEATEDGTMLDPDRYLPPSHRMLADALKFQEYDQAVSVYEDILNGDKQRYGDNDLVCAIDYHNLGVTCLLAKEYDAALYYFQEAVVFKRTCLGHNDPTVSDSLVEIGILLYNQNDHVGALKIFKEALEIYNDCSNDEGFGRTCNNIGCVYYKMGDTATALSYIQQALVCQRRYLGKSEKAESSLLNFALSLSNVGYLKLRSGHLDATAMLEESLLVLESVLGDDNATVGKVKSNINLAKFPTDQE